VGERKASLFCEYAKVTVVSKDFTPGLNNFHDSGKIKLIKVKDLHEKDISSFLKNAFIVIPAANDAKLNEKIAGIAKDREIFVNRVDDIGDINNPVGNQARRYCDRYFHWRSKPCPFKIYPAKN